MSNISGTSGTVLPGVYTDVETQSAGISIPGGLRVTTIIGEGAHSEVIVAAAQGGGKDGLDSTWTTTIGADGRHFTLSQAPIVSNRTQLFRNGLPLVGTEGTATNFSDIFDYQVDIATGHITMQSAYLVDLGGSFWSASSLNVGVGQINSLTLEDVDAPSETWTIKCTQVQRTSLNAPIADTATFVAFGSVSGNIRDGYGNPIVWVSNNQVVSNGVLSFSIEETASTPFVPGDSFTVKVNSGVLNKNDSLTANYIPVGNLNIPSFFQNMPDIASTFGIASTDNNLTLGCQLAFANGAPGILCTQAAPPLPRRTSYLLETDFQGSPSIDGYILPFPPGVVPDENSEVHIFVTDPTTKVEKQLLANKYPFFTLTNSSNPTLTQFITSDLQAPSGWEFFYSVIEQAESLIYAEDGYVNNISATTYFSSTSYIFHASDVGKNVVIIEATNSGNIGTFPISAVTNGIATITNGSSITEHNVRFEVQDPDVTTGAYLVLNHNVVPLGNDLRVTIVDARDASFFDAGWLNALAALETVECDILVPLPKQTISLIFQNCLNHCITMSNILNKKERVLFIGAINGLTPDNLTGAKLAAVEDIGVLEGIQGATVADILDGNTEDLANYSVPAAYGNTYRCVYFYPDQIVVQAGSQNVLVSGYYLAAAAGGFFSGMNNTAMPLTNKTLTGFTILRNKQFSNFTLTQLAGAGVTVLQPVGGGGNVIWGITTTQSGFVEEQEISIVFIRDRIAKALRSGFAAFIGMPDDDSLLAKVNARAQSILTSFITQGLISAYKDLLVMRDSIDPTQLDVTVRVQPIYAVNIVFIKVSVGTL